MSTTVEGTGSATWTVTFQEGTYHYQCDPHFTQMKGDITVETGAPLPAPAPPTTTTTTTTSTPPPPPAASAGPEADRLRRPGATISLRFNGRKVTTLKAGLVSITIRRSLGDGQLPPHGPRREPGTSKLGSGTVTWRLSAEARALPLPLGRDRRRSGARSASPSAAARARSSSAFSSAPKSSATAE